MTLNEAENIKELLDQIDKLKTTMDVVTKIRLYGKDFNKFNVMVNI